MRYHFRIPENNKELFESVVKHLKELDTPLHSGYINYNNGERKEYDYFLELTEEEMMFVAFSCNTVKIVDVTYWYFSKEIRKTIRENILHISSSL